MRELGIATIHPELICAYASFGVFRSATDKGLARIQVINIRDHAVDRHGSIDDRPYGGGDSMIMRPEPLKACVEGFSLSARVILTSARGTRFTHADAVRLASSTEPLLFICGRFAGVDQRFIDGYVDEEISCGDFIVSGGELPVLMIIDALLRQIPGTLGNAASAPNDSFAAGFAGGLEHPLYTRPQEFEGAKVPEVLLSGDHAAIAEWRRCEAQRLTRRHRPDLDSSAAIP